MARIMDLDGRVQLKNDRDEVVLAIDSTTGAVRNKSGSSISSGLALTPVNALIDYTAHAGELVLADASAGLRTITEPAVRHDGDIFGVYVADNGHTVKVNCPATGFGFGSTFYNMTLGDQSILLMYDAANQIWIPFGGFAGQP